MVDLKKPVYIKGSDLLAQTTAQLLTQYGVPTGKKDMRLRDESWRPEKNILVYNTEECIGRYDGIKIWSIKDSLVELGISVLGLNNFSPKNIDPRVESEIGTEIKSTGGTLFDLTNSPDKTSLELVANPKIDVVLGFSNLSSLDVYLNKKPEESVMNKYASKDQGLITSYFGAAVIMNYFYPCGPGPFKNPTHFHTPYEYGTLEGKTILNLGLGGLGNITTPILALSGANLINIDCDAVERDNSVKQPFYWAQDCEQPKANVITRKLKVLCRNAGLNNNIIGINKEIIDLSDLSACLKEYNIDLVINVTDSSRSEKLCGIFCADNNIPYIYSGIGVAPGGNICTFYPKRTVLPFEDRVLPDKKMEKENRISCDPDWKTSMYAVGSVTCSEAFSTLSGKPLQAAIEFFWRQFQFKVTEKRTTELVIDKENINRRKQDIFEIKHAIGASRKHKQNLAPKIKRHITRHGR